MTQTTQLSPEIQSQLSQLKDIHLPDPISWWPLALGWWILIVLILGLCIAIICWHFSKRRRLIQHTLQELDILMAQNDSDAIAGVSELLRRVALRCNLRHQGHSITNISGQAWADMLSTEANTISQEQAAIIAQAPYAPVPADTINITILKREVKAWIIHTIKRAKL